MTIFIYTFEHLKRLIINLIFKFITINILIMSLYYYFHDKYKDDEEIDEEYCDELSYFPNTKEYLDFINDLRTLLNDRKISNWNDEEKEICNIFNTPKDKNNKECHSNTISCILHGCWWVPDGGRRGTILWSETLYPGNDCLPQQLLNDFKEILDNNNDIRSMWKLWDKYKEIKKKQYSETYCSDVVHKIVVVEKENKKLIEENKKLIEENIQLVEKEDVRKKVKEWLENKSRDVNFKNGKELYDIIN